MAKEQNVEAPKECASATITAVLGRFEKLEKLKSKKASAQLTKSLSNFLHVPSKNE